MLVRKDRGGYVRPLPNPGSKVVANVLAESDEDGRRSIELQPPSPTDSSEGWRPTGYMSEGQRSAARQHPGCGPARLGSLGRLRLDLQIIYRPAIPPDPSTSRLKGKASQWNQASKTVQWNQAEPRGVTHLDHAGDQNAGLVNLIHAVMVLAIVGLIVAYIVDKA